VGERLQASNSLWRLRKDRNKGKGGRWRPLQLAEKIGDGLKEAPARGSTAFSLSGMSSIRRRKQGKIALKRRQERAPRRCKGEAGENEGESWWVAGVLR